MAISKPDSLRILYKARLWENRESGKKDFTSLCLFVAGKDNVIKEMGRRVATSGHQQDL